MCFVLLALISPAMISPEENQFSGRPLERPSQLHRLGTTDLGKDILIDLLIGSRTSISIMGGATVLGLLVATSVGVSAGLAGRAMGPLLSRALDIFMAIPQLPAMVVASAYLPANVFTTIAIIAAFGWPSAARIIRARALGLQREDYVTASHVCGASKWRIARSHIAPGLLPILVATSIGLASRAVSTEAGLAVLGLGDPLNRSWGVMMRSALNYPGLFFTHVWFWWLLPVVTALCLLVTGITLLGIGLERIIDPRLRSGYRAREHAEKD